MNCFVRIFWLAYTLMFLGCASAPQWTRGISLNLSTYYYQGVGYDLDRQDADRYAYVGLEADKAGVSVVAASVDTMESRRTNEREEVKEFFQAVSQQRFGRPRMQALKSSIDGTIA